jgi:hypothetical protein
MNVVRMAPLAKPSLDDESTFTDIERPRVPRPSIRPEIRPPAPRDDDDATLVYSSGMRAAPLAPPVAKRESVRPRAASMFPPPPVDRPRVFERPVREEKSARTILRPSLRDERTDLRPVTYAAAAPIFPPHVQVERPSLRAVTLEADEPSIAPRPTRPEPRERVAIAAAAALFAPIVLAFAFLGPGDAVAMQATLITPPVLASAVLTSVDARAVPNAEVTPIAAAPVVPSAPAVIDVEPTPRPVVRVATAPAPRANAPRPAILTPPAPHAVAPKAVPAPKSGLPDAEAASALARAQLEAALR